MAFIPTPFMMADSQQETRLQRLCTIAGQTHPVLKIIVITIQKALIGNPSSSRLESDRFINKGDHIRLKEMRIAYSLGDVFKKSVGLNNLTIYVRGTNLITWVF